jgi:hypothetical protein
MSEVKTVTPEELQELKKVRDEIDSHVITLGQIQYQRILLDFQEERLKLYLLESKEKERDVTDKLLQKYGNVTVDIETGTIS